MILHNKKKTEALSNQEFQHNKSPNITILRYISQINNFINYNLPNMCTEIIVLILGTIPPLTAHFSHVLQTIFLCGTIFDGILLSCYYASH